MAIVCTETLDPGTYQDEYGRLYIVWDVSKVDIFQLGGATHILIQYQYDSIHC